MVGETVVHRGPNGMGARSGSVDTDTDPSIRGVGSLHQEEGSFPNDTLRSIPILHTRDGLPEGCETLWLLPSDRLPSRRTKGG